MNNIYIEQETIEQARINYENAMKEVQELIATDGKELKEKIAYMRHLGDTYRAYLTANMHI